METLHVILLKPVLKDKDNRKAKTYQHAKHIHHTTLEATLEGIYFTHIEAHP